MKRTEIMEVFERKDELIDKEVYLRGWIRYSRFSKNIGFIELNDGTCFQNIQIVIQNELENFEEIEKFRLYSSIKVTGKVVKSENPKQEIEVLASNIELEAMADEDYPLQNKRHTQEYLRIIAHLRPRANTYRAVFRVRSLVAMAIHEYFQKHGYIYVHTPIITSSDAEGAGEMFTVTNFDLANVPMKEEEQPEKNKENNKEVDFKQDFFGKNAHLTVSGQLNVETFAHAFSKVYTFGPTFRAENSNTLKHAAEFWMVEPEIAFADLSDMMDVAENSLKYVISYVMKNAKTEIEFLDKFVSKGLIEKLENALNNDFARITYTEAIEKLKKTKKKFKVDVEWGMDLDTEHERYLAEEIFKKPVFLTDYPKDIKAFYMKLNEDGKTVAAADLLVPGIGELIGGSQREDKLDVLEGRMDELNMNKDEYYWYLDLRKYGSVEHSGFGIGFERLIMYITGIQNIRDTIAFPRTPNNCDY